MVTAEEKSRYEKRIKLLEKDRQKTNELVTELIKKIADMQSHLRSDVQKGQNVFMGNPLEYLADIQ